MSTSTPPLTPGDRLVPWIASLPDSWSIVPLKHVVKINAVALPGTTSPDYELEYIDISGVNSRGEITEMSHYRFENAPSRARRVVRAGDTIVSTVRTYLRAIAFVEEAPENLICSTGFAVLTPGDEIEPRFLAYWCRSTPWIDEVVARSTGVSYPAVNSSEIGSLPIPHLPREEQRAIADYLDEKTAAIDALIAKKQKLIAACLERRGVIIGKVVTQGLDDRAPKRVSGYPTLCQIPAHWRPIRLKYLAMEPFTYGANESAELTDPELPRYIRITDLNSDGTLREETFQSLPEAVAKPYLLRDGDILLARSGATVGKAVRYRPDWGRACFAGYLIRFRADPFKVIPEFVELYTQSQAYLQEVRLSLPSLPS